MRAKHILGMGLLLSVLGLGSTPEAAAQSPRYRSAPTRQPQARGRPSQARSRWQVAGADASGYLGGRYHTQSTVLPDLPFGSGDFSGVIGLELHEATAYWLVALGMQHRPSGHEENDVRYVLTPELNLILKDRMFLGGAGILKSYASARDAESGWSRTYYQLLLGLDFSAGQRFSVTVFAVYPFASWSRLRDFSGSDLEYSAGISYRF